ncbi:MAG: ribosome maturation factor RimM [Candidatus Pelagadaptatus aseana]|uniref:ribosome maturation factor RimM n=1 Tax=Candidatus Pelagadaptatus aseana TaxID=3120508 RepID=UPI0039B32A64
MTESGAKKRSNLINVGRITTVFGVKGWVKVHSDTQPRENICSYNPWWLKTRHGVKSVEIDDFKPHGDALVVHIKGIDDRDEAREICQVDVAVERQQMPDLEEGDYYWHQLQGLRVVTVFEGNDQDLGTVTRLLETGANDVLVVKGDANSIDQKERLIPYVPDQFVVKIDLEQQSITVDWDPEF